MNNQSNLAFALDEPTELHETEALDAAELASLLRLSSGNAERAIRPRAARGRRVLASFKDNHSGAFRPFRVY